MSKKFYIFILTILLLCPWSMSQRFGRANSPDPDVQRYINKIPSSAWSQFTGQSSKKSSEFGSSELDKFEKQYELKNVRKWDADYINMSLDIGQKQRELNPLNRKLKKLEQQRDILRKELAKLQGQLAIVVAKINKTKKLIKIALSDLGMYSDKAFPNYWAELKKFKKEKAILETKIAALQAKIAALQAQIDVLKNQTGIIKNSISHLKHSLMSISGPGAMVRKHLPNIPLADLRKLMRFADKVGFSDSKNGGYLQGFYVDGEFVLYAYNPRRKTQGQGGRGEGMYFQDGSLHFISPIVLDLDGDYRLEASEGNWLPHSYTGTKLVNFDITGNGFMEQIEWVGPNDGLLLVYDGGEVNGNHLFGTAGGFENGYEKLSLLDTNRDKVLTDKELTTLSVWQDKNGNAQVDSGEITSVVDLGITAIHVQHKKLLSFFVQNGKRKNMWDWYPACFERKKVK